MELVHPQASLNIQNRLLSKFVQEVNRPLVAARPAVPAAVCIERITVRKQESREESNGGSAFSPCEVIACSLHHTSVPGFMILPLKLSEVRTVP